MMIRIAVLGAGAGGCAAAADFVLRGAEVRLYNRSPERLEAIRRQGGIRACGPVVAEFVKIPIVTTRLEEALDGADLVWFFTTAHGHAHYAEICAPHLREGQPVILSPGSAGSLIMRKILRERHPGLRPILAETLSLPYVARILEPGSVTIYCRMRVRLAALPATETARLIARVAPLLEAIPATNVLEVALLNPNYLIHPLPYLMNLGEIERNQGMFAIYSLGMTPSILKVMHALDAEKMAVCRAVGVPAPDIDAVYDEFGTGPMYRQSEAAAKTQVGGIPEVHDRFLDEDVPLALVTLASLGRMLGVPTPVADAVITLSSAMRGMDFWKNGRTVEALGIAGQTAEQLTRALQES